MPKIIVNGKEYQVDEGITLIQACDSLGIQIPRFCYHEKLPSVGSCRMCAVELKGAPKLVSSCTTSVFDGMEVVTESDKVDQMRKTMLEILLINHPLDCPICDKGGECDLQDQTYAYGLDRSSIDVQKRSVEKKDFGPLIDSYMTRCIHCTRCVRFCTEIAGVESLGAIGRGDETEINTYVGMAVTSELSGNIADVCPVGALTNSNYAYKARPWELISTETIDIMDALGSNIKVDSSPLDVLRILPRLNESINEEWLADKSRYIVDALRVQRLDTPLIRENGHLRSATWEEAFETIKNNLVNLKGEEISAIAGNFNDVETMFALKELMESLGSSNIDCRIQNILFNNKDTSSYLFNSQIASIDDSDAILIIGSNPRKEAPVLNARIRKAYLSGNVKIALVGEKEDLTYNYDHLGGNSNILQDILSEKHDFAQVLKSAKKPMLILGLGALLSDNAEMLINLCKAIANKFGLILDDWNGFNVLQTSSSLVGGLEIGFVPKDYKVGVHHILEDISVNKIKFTWLLNADELNFNKFQKNTFVVYQGHHGDAGASIANVVLPGCLWLEKDGTYVNMERRVQKSYKCVSPIGQSKEDWKIIRKFSEVIDKALPYNNLEELREKMSQYNTIFNNINIEPAKFSYDSKADTNIIGKSLLNIIKNYYITDVISKNSLKMNECTKLFVNNKSK